MSDDSAAPTSDRLGEAFFAFGIAVFLVGGIATAVLAARVLPPAEYTVFAAFSAVLGVVVLGPAGALEQRSAQIAGLGASTFAGLRRLTRPILVIWIAVGTAAVLLPASWRDSYFSHAGATVELCLLALTPAVVVAAVLRGLATGQRRYLLVGSANAATGIAILTITLGLLAIGVAPLEAFISGPVLAWLLPLVYVGSVSIVRPVRARPPSHGDSSSTSPSTRAASGWLVSANLLMIANLLSVPAILRFHAGQLPEETVAAAQLVVSTSRLVTTAALAFMPLAIGRASAMDARQLHRASGRFAALSAAAAAVCLLVMVPLVGPILTWLTKGSVSVRPILVAFCGFPIVALIPTFVLMTTATARGRERIVAVGWLIGLVCLAAVAFIDVGDRPLLLLSLIAVCTLPPLLLAYLGGQRGHAAPDGAIAEGRPRDW